MATARSASPVLTAAGAVHTSVGDWLPTSGYGANFSTVLFLDRTNRKREVRPARKPRLLELLEQAESFQRMLANGEARSRAHLASAFGLSRPRVTQIMNLLTLHPAVLDVIRRMPLESPKRWVTEKQLRPLVQLSLEEQERAMGQYVPQMLLEGKRRPALGRDSGRLETDDRRPDLHQMAAYPPTP